LVPSFAFLHRASLIPSPRLQLAFFLPVNFGSFFCSPIFELFVMLPPRPSGFKKFRRSMRISFGGISYVELVVLDPGGKILPGPWFSSSELLPLPPGFFAFLFFSHDGPPILRLVPFLQAFLLFDFFPCPTSLL